MIYHTYKNPYDVDMYFFLKKFINIEYTSSYSVGYYLINHNDIDKLLELKNIVGNNIKKTKVLCLYGWEAYTDFLHLDEFYTKAEEFGFNVKNFVIIYNNIFHQGVNSYKTEKFKKIYTLGFPRMLFEKHLINVDEFSNIHNKRIEMGVHDFSCFNRLGRKHKKDVINHITRLKLDSYTTYKLPDGFNVDKNAVLVNVEENENDIPNHLEFYNGKVNICVETLYNEIGEESFCKIVHLTEKIFRNVMLKIPFTLISTQESLRNFKKLGFKTFDSLIDESYDTESDATRYKSAIKSAQELLPLYDSKSVQDILDYNFNLLIDKSYIKNMFKKLFENPLKNHLNNLVN